MLNQNVVSKEILDHIKETSNSEVEQDSIGAIGATSAFSFKNGDTVQMVEQKHTEEDVLHRLPNNYFMQDDDEEDLDMVV